MKHNITRNDGEITSVLVVLDNGKMLTATPEHPNFQQIFTALAAPVTDAEMQDLFDVSLTLASKFQRLSERVSISGGRIYFDGDEVHGVLTEAIVTFHHQGNEDFHPLVMFMEKIAMNPNPVSRDNLFTWLMERSFAICPDGDFIGYKSVFQDGDSYLSSHAGTAIVNGRLVHGRIPTTPDSIVEMPRSAVADDINVECSTGLHVGTWDYASAFSGNIKLRVKVNPRDVVSVPRYDSAKMRVCRYRVLDAVTAKDESMLFVPKSLDRIRALAQEPSGVVLPPPNPSDRKRRPGRKPEKVAKQTGQTEFPRYYEQYTTTQLMTLPMADLRWLAKEYELKGVTANLGKAVLAAKLRRKGLERQKTW